MAEIQGNQTWKKKKKREESGLVNIRRILKFLAVLAVAISFVVFFLFIRSSPPSQSIPYRRSTFVHNLGDCSSSTDRANMKEFDSPVHVVITLDTLYLRGSIAAVESILANCRCRENVFFHFLLSNTNLKSVIQHVFPHLKFQLHYFDSKKVQSMISNSIRQSLDQPLNYARNYIADLLEPSIHRVIYLDSDLIVLDDIFELWKTDLGSKTIGTPEYCYINFKLYFTESFWSDPTFSGVFDGRSPCYFNTGVMVIDLKKWRQVGYTKQIEKWMNIQKINRIYELGSMPPYLLLFAGNITPIDHKWNRHGLGSDKITASCNDVDGLPASLLHWSGSGKPWLRLDLNNPCPIDYYWALYDLHTFKKTFWQNISSNVEFNFVVMIRIICCICEDGAISR
ncbi:hypothetical protein HAX54_035972 [Datura stramonium]|uniref:Hexosyltransferase n=1 Tax=Datura stramonium TaxID=4076 RepID=A0ABS8VJX7_DATST|nr:hypothetical protein [Datura stramonium]